MKEIEKKKVLEEFEEIQKEELNTEEDNKLFDVNGNEVVDIVLLDDPDYKDDDYRDDFLAEVEDEVEE